jgi:Flp pilus assembly protein TadG
MLQFPRLRQLVGKLKIAHQCFVKDKKGISAVEFGLLAPIMLFVLGGVFDVSRYIWDQEDLMQALRAGMQYGTNYPSDTTGIVNVVKASTSLSGDTTNFSMATPTCGCTANSSTLPTSWLTCSATTCANNEYVQLTASYRYNPLVGKMIGVLPTSASFSIYYRIQ